VNRPADLVAIPPLARTVIYYVLALALVVVSALVGYGRLEPLWLVIVSGVGGVFFGVAGSNVASKPAGSVLVPDTEAPALADPDRVILVDGAKPVPDDLVGPAGYGSGV